MLAACVFQMRMRAWFLHTFRAGCTRSWPTCLPAGVVGEARSLSSTDGPFTGCFDP